MYPGTSAGTDDDDNDHDDDDGDDGDDDDDDDDNGHDDDECDAEKDMCRDGTTRRKLVLTSCNETEFSCHQSGKVLISSFLSFLPLDLEKGKTIFVLTCPHTRLRKRTKLLTMYNHPTRLRFFAPRGGQAQTL